MRRWVRRIGIIAVAVALLYFVGGSLAGGVIARWALTPGAIDWSGAHRPFPDDPFELGYRGDPQVALGLDFETVTYTSELGAAEAWLVPAARPSSTWAVYVHGIGGIRENGYRLLSILHDAGLPVLMITYRNDIGGHAPPGQPPFFSFGLTEWPDLAAAIDWAMEQGAEDVVIAAESMGAGIAGQYLVNEGPAKVAALVLDAPSLDAPAIAAGDAARLNLPFADVLAAGVLWVQGIVGPVRISDAVSLDTVAAFPGPVFVAHGRGDRLVPFAISERLVEMRTGRTVFVTTAAQHLRSFNANPTRYRGELLGFLTDLRTRKP